LERALLNRSSLAESSVKYKKYHVCFS